MYKSRVTVAKYINTWKVSPYLRQWVQQVPLPWKQMEVSIWNVKVVFQAHFMHGLMENTVYGGHVNNIFVWYVCSVGVQCVCVEYRYAKYEPYLGEFNQWEGCIEYFGWKSSTQIVSNPTIEDQWGKDSQCTCLQVPLSWCVLWEGWGVEVGKPNCSCCHKNTGKLVSWHRLQSRTQPLCIHFHANHCAVTDTEINMALYCNTVQSLTLKL